MNLVITSQRMIKKYPLPAWSGPGICDNRGNIYQIHLFFASVSELIKENKNIDLLLQQYKSLFESVFIPEDAQGLYKKISSYALNKEQIF